MHWNRGSVMRGLGSRPASVWPARPAAFKWTPEVAFFFFLFFFAVFNSLKLWNRCCWQKTVDHGQEGAEGSLDDDSCWLTGFCLHWKSPQHGNTTTGMTNSDTTIKQTCLYLSRVCHGCSLRFVCFEVAFGQLVRQLQCLFLPLFKGSLSFRKRRERCFRILNIKKMTLERCVASLPGDGSSCCYRNPGPEKAELKFWWVKFNENKLLNWLLNSTRFL